MNTKNPNDSFKYISQIGRELLKDGTLARRRATFDEQLVAAKRFHSDLLDEHGVLTQELTVTFGFEPDTLPQVQPAEPPQVQRDISATEHQLEASRNAVAVREEIKRLEQKVRELEDRIGNGLACNDQPTERTKASVINPIARCRYTGRPYVRGIGCNCATCVARDERLMRPAEQPPVLV